MEAPLQKLLPGRMNPEEMRMVPDPLVRPGVGIDDSLQGSLREEAAGFSQGQDGLLLKGVRHEF